jgi:tight adherence protein C
MSTLFISVAIFVLVGGAAFAVYFALYGSNRVVEERFADIAVKMRASQGTLEGDAMDDASFARTLFKWAASRVPAPNMETPQGEKLAQSLQQAGFIRAGSAQAYQVVRILSAIAFGVLGFVIGTLSGSASAQGILYAVAGSAAGLFAPSYYVGRRARRRQLAISRQLSDVLDLLVVCVEAGLGLYEAIKIVGTECDRQGQEIGHELSLVSSEISAGASLGQALRNLAERTAVEDIKPLAATLIQSEQLGAQISPALHASSDALRTRRRLRAEEAAQRASIKVLFPLVLFILPAMILVIIGPAMVQVLRTLSAH